MSEDAEPQKRPQYATKVDYNALAQRIGKREVSKPELLDWIFDHVGVHPNLIPPDDWPCFGAVRLLVEANADYPGFLALWGKLIPNQTQLKLMERTKDDGRALALLDALEADLANRAQRPNREHEVSAGGLEPGGSQPVSER